MNIFIQEHVFENVFGEMAAILCRGDELQSASSLHYMRDVVNIIRIPLYTINKSTV